MQELHLVKSPNPKKKWRIEFSDGKHIDFGAVGYQDYTQHHDSKRKELYLSRHKSHEDWTLEGVHTAGFWSRWLLWNMPSIEESIKDINKRFKEEKVKIILKN